MKVLCRAKTRSSSSSALFQFLEHVTVKVFASQLRIQYSEIEKYLSVGSYGDLMYIEAKNL